MSTLPTPPAAPSGPPPPLGARVPREAHPTHEDLRGLLRGVLTARTLELRTVELYRQNRITGGCYTGVGNEATSVATAWAMAPGDVLVPTHRDMGSHLVRGHDPLTIMRQYMKRATSQTGGKDSSLHLGAEGSDIVGMISPLAHMMPVACGVALAERTKGTNASVLTSVGDGSTSLGDFHESLNFAGVHKLPILFVIVNNQYAYSTPNTMQYACERLADRAVGYGMPGVRVDGTDAIEVLHESRLAFARARRGEGSTLLESVTMRLRGHSEHDDHRYVPPALLESWRAWDPLVRLEAHAQSVGAIDAAGLTAMRDAIEAEIDRAIEIAEAEPLPDPSEAGRDVFRRWDADWTVPERSWA